VQERVWIRRALDDRQLNIQVLTVFDRDIGKIRLQEREFRLGRRSTELLASPRLGTTEA
jgi:hypothetical protein